MIYLFSNTGRIGYALMYYYFTVYVCVNGNIANFENHITL